MHGLLHVAHGVLHRHHAGELEEGGLQDHVGVVAQAQLTGQTVGVHDIELHVVAGDVLLDVAGQLLRQFLLGPGGVQQEGAAVLDLVDHVVAGDVGLGVAGQEIRRLDEIGGADGTLAEPQVALGDAVGLLGVVLEVGLRIHTGVVANDLSGVLVSAHRTIGAQTPDLAGHGVGGLGDERLMDIQRQVSHIVVDADGEQVLAAFILHVVEHGLHLGGCHVLGGQTIAAAVDLRGVAAVGKGGAHIQIHSTGNGTRLLGAVHGGDLLHRSGQGVQEILHVEGAEQMDLHQAHLLALGTQIVHHLTGTLAGGAHHHHDTVGILGAVVIENVVVPAGDLVDALHIPLYHSGDAVIGAVVGLLRLVVDVGALHGGTHHRVLRVHGDGVIVLQRLTVQQLLHLVQIDDLDLLDLVAGAEAVVEVDEGYTGLDGGQVGHGSQIHDLLHAAGGHHSDAGGTAAHDILMVTEDVVGVLGHGTGRHVEHGGHPVTGHDVQVGDHQQQTLRGGEGGGQRTGLRHAVEGAGSARLGLHLHQPHRLAEHILLTGGRPLIHLLAHGRGGSDGVDTGYIGEMVGNSGTGLVTVHGFHDFLIGHYIAS